MGIKEQLLKIKENWLLVLLFILLVGLVVFKEGVGPLVPLEKVGMTSTADYAIAEAGYARGSIPPYYPSEDFAPEIKDRKITKNAYLSNEVERGIFFDTDAKIKSIISSTDSFLLSENTYKSGASGRRSYYTGSYQIKVESKKYAAVVSQLKELGEVNSFTENADDVTGSYTDLQHELDAEKARLSRYKTLLSEAKTMEEKLQLTDRIFQQERTVQYLEDALKNIDKQVSYSTISLNIQEKQSEYADLMLVKVSDLVQRLVNSVNGVLQLVFWLLPYALAGGLGWWIVKKVQGKKIQSKK